MDLRASAAGGGRMEYAPVPLHETRRDGGAGGDEARNIGVCNMTTGMLWTWRTARRGRRTCCRWSATCTCSGQLMRFCSEQGIAVTGFSPLGSGSTWSSRRGRGLPVARGRRRSHRRGPRENPAQVALRWGPDGAAVIPKSSDVGRLKENLSIFDFTLTDEEVAQIATLDRHRRFNDPGVFTTGMNSFCPIFD